MIDRIGGGLKDYVPVMLRVGLAVIFILQGAHSVINLTNSASAWKIVFAAVEILGGLFCLIGFLTRWAAFALIVLIIYRIINGPQLYAFTRWDHQVWFATLVLAFACYGLGGGKWSVDEKQKKKD
jgi:uncharacterized membrane protein YphA (DoxX/SURF4 family)